ncbi:MAG: TIGR04219 family outer membrane beta-barrel protein [Deltaproteobacteria bacterium]|nr:TIGR04219 family outer membrane beta-barrel protein [Deltaproteobacteria bacterium]
MIIGLPLLLFPRLSLAIGLEAAIGIWNQEPQGKVGYKGDSLDLINDLKYSSGTQFFGRVKIDMPLLIPNFYILATPLGFDGTATKNVSFKFGNQTFNADIPFSSTLRLDHYDLALFYGVPFLKQATLGKINIDGGLNMRVMDIKAGITQGGNSEARSFYLVMPMVYLGFQVKPVDFFSLEGEVRVVAYNSNHHYDLIGRVKYKIFDFIFVSAGYRYEEIAIDQSDVKLDSRVSGPLLEAGFQF